MQQGRTIQELTDPEKAKQAEELTAKIVTAAKEYARLDAALKESRKTGQVPAGWEAEAKRLVEETGKPIPVPGWKKAPSPESGKEKHAPEALKPGDPVMWRRETEKGYVNIPCTVEKVNEKTVTVRAKLAGTDVTKLVNVKPESLTPLREPTPKEKEILAKVEGQRQKEAKTNPADQANALMAELRRYQGYLRHARALAEGKIEPLAKQALQIGGQKLLTAALTKALGPQAAVVKTIVDKFSQTRSHIRSLERTL